MEIIDMLEQMAEYGHAPEEGCSLFGVGYDDAFDGIKKTYLIDKFNRGKSSEKFIVGPFGSGKTHFLRQLLEISRSMGCVTSEINLNKDLDFTKNLLVYSEMVKEIRAPGRSDHGIRPLLDACLQNIKSKSPSRELDDQLINAWIMGLDKADYKLYTFGKVVKLGINAYYTGDEALFETACRWLEGDISNKEVAKKLSTQVATKDEQNIIAKRMMLSLFQFIHLSGFQGTVVGMDEAEQGLSVDKKKLNKILSMLQSGINAMADLDGGSALIIFALTPDIVENMEKFAALQLRVADPSPTSRFFDGNTYAPKIDLSMRKGSINELKLIGNKMVEMLYKDKGNEIKVDKQKVIDVANKIAEEISKEGITSSYKRTLAKRTCSMLMSLYRTGQLPEATINIPAPIPTQNDTDKEV